MKALIGIAIVLGLLAPLSPTYAQSSGSLGEAGTEWRLADRFRLFEKASPDAKVAVDTLVDRLEALQSAKLADHYDAFLSLLSDQETGYALSDNLRISHYRVRPDVDGPGRYDPEYLYPQQYVLLVRTLSAPQVGKCTYRSKIEETRGDCRKWTRISVPAGDGEQAFAGGRGSITVLRDGTAMAEITYDFDDALIVALGDSFISGEGNPDVPSVIALSDQTDIFARPSWGDKVQKDVHLIREARWWDAPCHRSLLSWPVLASLADAARHPQRATTLVHLGCSGAVIDDLIERGETDLPGGGNETQSQITQLKTLLDAAPKGWARRMPDRVLLSIGGNDIGFSGVLTTLTLPPNGFTIGPLATRYIGKKAGAVCPYRNTGRPLSRLCHKKRSAQARLEDLPHSFERLTSSLKGIGIDARTVFHAQYPNPLICAGGRPCDNNPSNDFATKHATGNPNGFEALMGIFPKKGRGFRYRSWNFEIHYKPEPEFSGQIPPNDRLLYSDLPEVLCDKDAEQSDSEVCQALWVHYKLNSAVSESGFGQIDAHLRPIRGHGLIETGEGPDLSLPLADMNGWITKKTPATFKPYARSETGRWFRLPNDSILTQYHFHGDEPRFHHGTVHPTYRAHLEIAQAVLDQAFAGSEGSEMEPISSTSDGI